MKENRLIPAIIAEILIFLLFVTVPVAFAREGGRGRGDRIGGAGRSGGGHTQIHRSPSSRHYFRDHRFYTPSRHHRSHHNHFFFGFGASTFAPGWWWHDPYYAPYSWGASPYYPYYDYPYSDYYGYPSYWSDPCLSPDPAYAPYCPPTADNPYYQGYGIPPVDYPLSAPPPSPESGPELQSPPPPQ